MSSQRVLSRICCVPRSGKLLAHTVVPPSYHHHLMVPSHQEDLVHPMILFLLPASSDDSKNKDDDQNYKKMHPHFLLITRIRNSSRGLSKKFEPLRLNWTDCVTQLVQQNEFAAAFRMSLLSFNKLVEALRVKLEIDADQARQTCKKSGPVQPDLVVSMSLQWLAGVP